MPETRRSEQAASSWAPWVAALLGAATVVLAEPGSLDPGEILEGLAGGSGGMPWLRLRACVLAIPAWLPIGTVALRLGLGVALLHAAVAALVARRSWLSHREADRGILAGCGVLAGVLAVSFPAALEAVRVPSAAALGVIVLFVALAASGPALAFAAGLLLAVDPVLFVVGAGPLWLRARPLVWRSVLPPFAAGALPLLVAFAPGRAFYTFALVWPAGWGSLRAALVGVGQIGLPAAGLAVVGLGLAIRRGGETGRAALERLSLLAAALLLAALTGPIAGRSALLTIGALVAESVVTAVWLGGVMLLARGIPLARASVALVLVLLLAWPLSRLDAAVGHPLDARIANAAVDLPLLSEVPDRSIVLLRDAEAERFVLGAQATSALSASVDVFPLRYVESTRAREALLVDPTLAPVARETLLAGAPSELVLGNLAALRPVFLEVTPATSRPIAKHLAPAGALFRFDAEPRAASDRALALDAQKSERAFAAAHAAASADAGRRLIRSSRRLALALCATGEKESAARGVDQLRAVAGDEPLVSLLLRKSVLQGTNVDLADVVIEE